MKKIVYLMFLAVMPMCFSACSSEDENGGINAQLIGTWQKMHNDGTLGNDLWVFQSDGTMYMHYTDANGNIIYTDTYRYRIENQYLYTDYLGNDEGEEDDWKDQGAISIKNNILTVVRSSGNEKRYKKIK
ncbi:MAG: hypothetical protein J5630_06485 [Bacteroidaceae bacterium]|nr:hypothetical protein [Bacteroidaceae bacterium]